MTDTKTPRGAKTEIISDDLEELALRLGHSFRDPALLIRALTHTSATAPHARNDDSYERLEFLGDRVLGLIVAELLYRRFRAENEGALAMRHAELVRRETVAGVARELGLSGHIRLAKAEVAAGERDNPALLSNACEAVIAAVYLDGGLEAARALIEPLWTPLLEAALEPPRDAKTALQEWAQARGLPLPEYREVGRSGAAHEPVFTIEVQLEGQGSARGEGRSKRLAEQGAAESLLTHLQS